MFEYRYKPPFYLRRWFQVLVVLCLVAAVATYIAIYIALDEYREEAYEYKFADINKLEKASIIYDRSKQELGRIFVVNRDPVELEKVPYHMQQALVAIEDARFYQHSGVDYMGIIRAVLRNLKSQSKQQGASTITQQLARNAYEMKRVSYERKLVEAFLAHRIEQNFSKGEIMELYLNRIYFGSGYYGVNAASRGYFGKEVENISIEEAATLCGLIKSPGRLSPFNNPDASKRARDYVFERMVNEQMITRIDADRLKAKPIKTVTRRRERKRSFEYAYEQIRQQVVRLIGQENASKGGFEIYTTIDSALQQSAQQTLVGTLNNIENRPDFKGEKFNDFDKVFQLWKDRDVSSQEEAADQTGRPLPKYLQGGILVTDTSTGAIRAMVGGRDFAHSPYDRTTQARRKSGTAFTPFVYAAGFAAGMFPGSKVNDFPIDAKYVQIGALSGILGEWGVEGAYERENWITARSALVKGKNAATVRFGIDLGVDKVVSLAKDAGMTFKGELQKYNASFLGHSEVSMSEMALAYSVFPNGGRRPKELFIIDTIRDREGTKIFEQENEGPSVDVMDSYAAYQVHSALTDVMKEGTASKAYTDYGLSKFPVAGKTGTSYNSEDNWFVGYTDKITCTVWSGFDRARKKIYPLAYSNNTVLPAWVTVMNQANEIFPAKEVKAPMTAHPIEVCKLSGNRATEFCYHTERIDGTENRIHDTYIEFLNPKYTINRRCAVHSVGGKVNMTYNQPIIRKTNDRVPGAARPIYSLNVPPIIMQEQTVLGDDPYHARRLIVKPRIIAKPPPEPEEGAEGEEVSGEVSTDGTPLVPTILPDGTAAEPAPLIPPGGNPGIFRTPQPTNGTESGGFSPSPNSGQNPSPAQPGGGSIFRSQNPAPVPAQPLGTSSGRPQPLVPTTIQPQNPAADANGRVILGPNRLRRLNGDEMPSILEEVPNQNILTPPKAERVPFE